MPSDRAPKILVATSRRGAATEYVEALREAGAVPVLIDVSSDRDNPLDGMDGLLLTGGGDVDPALYDAPDSPLVEDVDRERDELEIRLVHDARKRGLATLCICRGLQVANVAFGGTLIADIPSHTARTDAIAHNVVTPDGRAERGLIPNHVVRIDPDSTLARIVEVADLHTGARHHQAVDRCADELRVVASTDDGVVEALELRAWSRFWLAVQWHPESTRDLDDGASKKLFRAFVSAANRNYPTDEEWLAELRPSERRRVNAMIATLTALGEPDAISWVRSEISENIAQTARWLFLRPLWRDIDSWSDREEVERLMHDAEGNADDMYSESFRAARRLLDGGAHFADIAAFARGVAAWSMSSVLYHLDGSTSMLGDEGSELPHWALMEVRGNEYTGRLLGALDESLLSVDPLNREGKRAEEDPGG